ncbi:MAG: glutathione S-transferase family protein [Steroidobacteraceae bacterium]
MTEQPVLYYNPMSRARIAHWMLEEVGAPYRIELLSFEKAEHKKPDFLALNPMGKLPTLLHRGAVVTESAAICTYLADAFPAAALSPALDSPERATYLRWLFFGAGCLEPAIIDRMLSRPAPERRSALGYGCYEDVLYALEQAITPGPFILRERFSAADVYIASQIGFGMMTKSLEPRPAFQAYLARTAERPAYKRFTEQAQMYSDRLKPQG